MYVPLDSLRGRTVLDAKGTILGYVRTPLVDLETWAVDTLRVWPTKAIANEFGLPWSWAPWKRPTYDVKTGLVHAASDAIILRVTLAELREAQPSPFEEVPAVH
jgi:sporulation protein YlmC with PRC-barrel domain